jgi:hypothetical protein
MPVYSVFGANDVNKLVVQPQSESFPQTYGEWGAQWWQFVLGIPACANADPAPCNNNPAEVLNPLLDTTGAKCQVGQWGPVFFLVGTTGNIFRPTGGSATRSCDVPADAALFFPINNISCAVPEDGNNFNEIRELCSGVIDQLDVKSLTLTIDGDDVKILNKYRASERFSFTGPEGGVYETCCCATPPCYVGFRDTAISDGYWAMLNPLRPGKHKVHFGGGGIDVTYNLTVTAQ